MDIYNRQGEVIATFEPEPGLSAARSMGRAVIEAIASGADLRGADLRGVDLGVEDLSDARFERCDFRGASFRGAILQGAHFYACDFRGADLAGAYCRDAYIGWSDLRCATLDNTELTGADMSASVLDETVHKANLSEIQDDFREMLSEIPPAMVSRLRDSIKWGCDYHPSGGGISYALGQIASKMGVPLVGSLPDPKRPAEKFFLAIPRKFGNSCVGLPSATIYELVARGEEEADIREASPVADVFIGWLNDWLAGAVPAETQD